jgi:glutamate dehydrogenase/leucine dehydrogenase
MSQIAAIRDEMETKKINLVDILKEVNVSGFLDSWGPMRILQVYDPDINMQGILVIDNNTLGPGCGFIKISPKITLREVFHNARVMTWSSALANVNFGGASAGIKATPSEIDKNLFVRAFAKAISAYVPDQFITVSGQDTGSIDMAAFMDEVGDSRGAINIDLNSLGLGFGIIIGTAIDSGLSSFSLPEKLAKAKIAIVGFNQIGCAAAKYLVNKGAKIVAISDDWCTISDSKGIALEEVYKHCSADSEKKSLRQCKGFKKYPKDEIIKSDSDIIIAVSGNDVFTKENVSLLKAKCVVESAFCSLPGIVDQTLHNRGVVVIPDILTSACEAIIAYSNQNGSRPERSLSLMETRMSDITKQIVPQAVEQNVSLRRICMEVAQERILKAVEGKNGRSM